MGKITNILSNDFNVIELKGTVIFALMTMPFLLIGNIVILVLRLGWPGIICPLVVVLLIPFQILLGKFASSMLKGVNVYKDERIKLCTEIIEGVKFIKLYGWEMAFKRIIQTLRKEKLRKCMWLSFMRALNLHSVVHLL